MPSNYRTNDLVHLTDEDLFAPHLFCPIPSMIYSVTHMQDVEAPFCCRRMIRRYHKSVADIAKTLNQAGIGCVLWDGSAYEVYGMFGHASHIEFVVADKLIDKAIEVLLATPPLFAGDLSYGSRQTRGIGGLCLGDDGDGLDRRPYVQLHTDYEDMSILLWKQSSTLWAMPPLTEMPIPQFGSQFNLGKLANELAPNYTVASHPRFPTKTNSHHVNKGAHDGRHPADLHPVVLLVPERGFETAMRLWARYDNTSEVLNLKQMVFGWMQKIQTCNDRKFIDVDLIMPLLRVLVKIAMKGDVTWWQIKVATREIFGEPAFEMTEIDESLGKILLSQTRLWHSYYNHFDEYPDDEGAINSSGPHFYLKVTKAIEGKVEGVDDEENEGKTNGEIGLEGNEVNEDEENTRNQEERATHGSLIGRVLGWFLASPGNGGGQ